MVADVLDFNSVRLSRLVADWPVENMTHDKTPYRISLDGRYILFLLLV